MSLCFCFFTAHLHQMKKMVRWGCLLRIFSWFLSINAYVAECPSRTFFFPVIFVFPHSIIKRANVKVSRLCKLLDHGFDRKTICRFIGPCPSIFCGGEGEVEQLCEKMFHTVNSSYWLLTCYFSRVIIVNDLIQSIILLLCHFSVLSRGELQ